MGFVCPGFEDFGLLVCARRRAPDFESGDCPARRSLFFACPKKRDEKKRHPKAWSALRTDSPALLDRKRALRNCLGPSLALALRAPHAAATGILPGLSLAALGQTVLALFRFLPAVLGCTKGSGCAPQPR